MTVVQEPGSSWSLSEEDGLVVAREGEHDIALLIDPTNAEQDQRYAGIYVIEAGQPRFIGSYYGSSCSMFVPDRPHMDQTAVVATASGATLSVEMTEGTLSEMVDSAYESDEPFRWTSTWSVVPQGLRLLASGLYYLLVPMDACEVTVLGEGGALSPRPTMTPRPSSTRASGRGPATPTTSARCSSGGACFCSPWQPIPARSGPSSGR